MRHELSDFEWAAIKPMRRPNKARGAAGVNDRRVLNGIFWRVACHTGFMKREAVTVLPVRAPGFQVPPARGYVMSSRHGLSRRGQSIGAGDEAKISKASVSLRNT
jgi:hypothetical protein